LARLAAQLDASRQQLAEQAEQLARGLALPVDVLEVADRLGVSVEVRARRGRRDGGVSRTTEGLRVVLFRAADTATPFSPRERFTLAHEYAHVLLHREGVRGPTTRSEYWQTEGVCHEFAGRLLIPDVALESHLLSARDCAGALRGLQRLVYWCDVSPAVASHRAGGHLLNATLIELVPATDNDQRRLATVRYCIENAPWLGQGAGKYIDADHVFAGLVQQQARSPAGTVLEHLLDGQPAVSLRRPAAIWAVRMPPLLAPECHEPLLAHQLALSL
jgi:hypothetical protein